MAAKVRVITVAVGGATCSGKTTLAKHLQSCLHDSLVIHQDDFAPPQDRVPVHPEHRVQDWDDAPGAIEWPRLAAALQHVRRTGAMPAAHASHEHLNERRAVPADAAAVARWRAESARVARAHLERHGERVVWAIVDGFLLYWSQAVVDQLDVRVFLRVPEDVLRRRRHERHGYHTAEGALWRDPPHYWAQIVYPAYLRAHADMFEGGDVARGAPTGKVENLLLFEGTEVGMDEMLAGVMEAVLAATEAR